MIKKEIRRLVRVAIARRLRTMIPNSGDFVNQGVMLTMREGHIAQELFEEETDKIARRLQP